MTEHAALNRFAANPAEGVAAPARTLPTRALPTRKTLAAVVLAVFAAGSAPAQDEGADDDSYYRYGSLAAVEGDVWHQRADEFGAEEAEANSPFLPGDRIWTREPGKVEIRFSGWVTAWMDEGTKLDYVEADRPHRLGFWTGSLLFRVGEESEVVVETPGGTLTPQGEGLYRLDVLDDRRTVQFGVREGIATVGNEAGSVLVRAGNRTVASAGEAPSAPESWRADDDFADWAANRQARFVRGEDVPYEDLPEEVREHVHDLDGHGRWAHDHDHGWIWYPAVAAAWSPYYHGRWAHTPFGYTWISYDPWGWAPFHYGRWGHGPRGWYWLPGHAWSPGWVSWAYGYDWIGWSPLSPFGYPVYGWGDFRGGGYGRPARGTVVGTAVPRGTAVGRGAVARGAGRGWSFTRRDALGRAASRNRLAVARLNRLDDAQVLERGAVLDRGLRRRAVGETAIARSASVTARGLANTGRNTGTVASRRQRAVGSAGRTALGWRRPAERHRADPAAAAAASSGGTRSTPVSAAARRVARPRTAATREAAAASGRAASASGRSPSATGTRVARPRSGANSPRSGANSPRSGGDASARGAAARRRGGAAARSGARPAASARPRSGAASSARPSSGARRRPGSASRARPRSGASSRPASASRSRPGSTARPRPSSSTRSRPSSTNRSRPSSGARSRPSSSARGRPSSTSRSRPSSTSRSRPSSASRSRPSSGARSRSGSGARSAPRSSGSRSGSSRARPRRPSR